MNNKVTITRRLEIDAGHRLKNHESKCKNVHGHRYVFLVTVTSPQLDRIGRVIDFGAVKEKLGRWLDEKWDHAFLYEHGDPVGEAIAKAGDKVFSLPVAPTAENMASFFHGIAVGLLGDELEIVNVRLYETPNCYADSRGVL